MIKNDKWIRQQAAAGMIRPFKESLVRSVTSGLDYPSPQQRKVLSYGTSSFGYDIRLSSKEFMVFQHVPGTVVDPKAFNSRNLRAVDLHRGKNGDYFILPAHSYGLGVALEHLDIPENITVLCIGKSTYARCGIIANLTPAEAAWRGHLTLEFSNSSGADCRIYANEGVCQLLFLEGDSCEITYHDRDGKYQDQLEQVTLAKI